MAAQQVLPASVTSRIPISVSCYLPNILHDQLHNMLLLLTITRPMPDMPIMLGVRIASAQMMPIDVYQKLRCMLLALLCSEAEVGTCYAQYVAH